MITTTESIVSPGRGSARGRRRKKWTFDRLSFFIVFLFLPLTIFLVLVIWPFIQAGYYSMTDWGGFSPDFEFTGFENYARLLQDQTFLTALGNNVLLAIVLPILTLGIALFFSTLVTVGGQGIGQTVGVKNSSFYRIVSFFPYVIPGIIIGIVFSKVFDPSNGLVNGLLQAVGLPGQVNWLGQVSTAMPVSIAVITWSMVGFYMLLFIAAIKSIPAEVFEAARLDGATRTRTALSITIPMIFANVQTAWIYLGIAALDAYIFMQGLHNGGGPDNATLVTGQYLFNVAFKKTQFGYASTVGVAMAVVTLAFAAAVFLIGRMVRRKVST